MIFNTTASVWLTYLLSQGSQWPVYGIVADITKHCRSTRSTAQKQNNAISGFPLWARPWALVTNIKRYKVIDYFVCKDKGFVYLIYSAKFD